jgi:hypothetical protein
MTIIMQLRFGRKRNCYPTATRLVLEQSERSGGTVEKQSRAENRKGADTMRRSEV